MEWSASGYVHTRSVSRCALCSSKYGSAVPAQISGFGACSAPGSGYIYNDLCQINGEQQVLIFPSGYKRDIKYGQVDAPSAILRTEVLNQWYCNDELRCVVTYPEALAEKVASRQVIDNTTITLQVGATVDLTETSKRLREFGFQEVDYVYLPSPISCFISSQTAGMRASPACAL